jgi:hypothetical protein
MYKLSFPLSNKTFEKLIYTTKDCHAELAEAWNYGDMSCFDRLTMTLILFSSGGEFRYLLFN